MTTNSSYNADLYSISCTFWFGGYIFTYYAYLYVLPGSTYVVGWSIWLILLSSTLCTVFVCERCSSSKRYPALCNLTAASFVSRSHSLNCKIVMNTFANFVKFIPLLAQSESSRCPRRPSGICVVGCGIVKSRRHNKWHNTLKLQT